ncbi:enoyl-CoA hydratase [Fictibacillus sp. KU28468]|uniref:enoyl-CoA hydratase n=1 Tax=Fictibacillus sp. KU28468 TaxID=2991053 RepID=UPI0006A76D10|nr:enoyl-CoA hydratase [Fictibacillus sp. KU28468]UZJ76875.1 enoyl-CoA hydratase [Fictibacillus sp. KU28468]SFD93939.1 Enoyl-CoA hydratase/carnithine racemase [Bacillus sp. OV194]
MGKYLEVVKDNHLAVITINNPPLNVLSRAVFQELDDTFMELEHDRETVAVVLTGEGEKAFVAGADIKEFPQMMGNPDMRAQVMEVHYILNRIDSFPKPTIAVLNGLTLGGGCELALSCDMRIAEEHSQIGLPEVTLGLFPGGGGTQRLPRLVGEAKAKEMMFTGEPISAAAAERIGLVNKVVPSGEGLVSAKQLASKITRHSLQALSRIKQSVDVGINKSLNEGIEVEASLFQEVFQTEDIKEGVQAFFEKRKPAFQHR